jgi:hypothetical protein
MAGWNDDVTPGTEYTQQAGMSGDISTDNVQDFAESAEQAATNAATSETNAASSASSAATSASNASTSATNAATSATQAASSASNAASSETAAATSASNASTSASESAASATDSQNSATASASSAANALTSENNAEASETAAAGSASSAATSATNASNSATAASTSATNAANSATAASTSETNAATSETNAANSATAAATSATNASNSASAASTSESNAANSATSASNSATNSANSATASASSASSAASAQSAAETARDQTLEAFDNFDDRYLGDKTSDPTLDNDGNALVGGALYFNTSDEIMKVYTGSAWVAAYASLSGAMLSVNNLSDVQSVSTSRTNLGLGTAATTDATDYATAAQGALADTALQDGDTVSSITLTTADINGGTIDGVTIGGASAGAGTFTTLTTGSTVTLNGGTANGVAYLNGSKVLTSGSALTFDGAGALVLGSGGSGTNNSLLRLNGSDASSYGSYLQLQRNGVNKWTIGTDSGINGGTSDDLTIYGTASQRFYASSSETMRLTSTGLLIGTTSNPQNSKLMVGGSVQVKPSANNSLEIFGPNSGTGIRLFARNDAGTLNRLELQGGQVIFPLTSGADGLYFDASSGNLGLGVTPSAKLDVKVATDAKLLVQEGNTAGNVKIQSVNNAVSLNTNLEIAALNTQFFNGGSERMRIDASGNLALGFTSANLENGGGMVVYNATVPRISLKNSTSGTAGSDGVDIALVSSDAYFFNRESGAVIFGTGGIERLRIDSSGNVGLGVTPSAWSSGKAVEVGSAGTSLWGFTQAVGYVTTNAYYNTNVAPGGFKYGGTGQATAYAQEVGKHIFYTAPSGTAGNAITFTQAMTLDASGNLLVGTSVTKGSRVHSAGASASASPTLGSATDTSLILSNSDVTYGMNFGVINNGNGWIQQHSNTGTAAAYNLLLQPVGGNVGIGVDPTSKLNIASTQTNDYLGINGPSSRSYFGYESGNTVIYAQNGSAGASNLIFAVGTSPAMRIDTSGNLLVGRTSVGGTGNGHSIRGGDSAIFSRDAVGETVQIGRNSSNGQLVRFNSNGATVGSISTNSNRLVIAADNGSTGGGLYFATAIIPTDRGGNLSDNTLDLGINSFRFDDIYATNGTIQTSDRNEKQDIGELSEAEQRVAVAAKGLLRKFRWKSKVEEKGDDARIHFGIIAQDLQAAFEDEGLDAGRYAMFIHSTWTDEETGEERSRMGVRYSELLAFIIAAI